MFTVENLQSNDGTSVLVNVYSNPPDWSAKSLKKCKIQNRRVQLLTQKLRKKGKLRILHR